MADLSLPNAVNSSESLLQPVWIPGKVIVDHKMRAALQVHAFTGRIICDEEPHSRVVIE